MKFRSTLIAVKDIDISKQFYHDVLGLNVVADFGANVTLDDYLTHITDEKPITARQCIKALRQIGAAKPQYIPRIIDCFRSADLSKYKDSMRPLIEQDMAETEKALIQ